MKKFWKWARTADIDPFSPDKSMTYVMWWTLGLGIVGGLMVSAAVRIDELAACL